jgi:hypothetical protein
VKLVLERLGSAAGVLLSLHLALPTRPVWADDVDADGRSVLLVGAHQLGHDDTAQSVVAAVLEALGEGTVPEGVHAIAYAPKASAAFAEIVSGWARHERG